jgi:hypothetical protein
METHTQPRHHFIGYQRFSEWQHAIDPYRDVYAASVSELSDGGLPGLVIIRHFIVVSQIDRDNHVHYARALTDRYESQDGVRPMFYAEQHAHRASSAWALLLDWLSRRHPRLEVRKAIVAVPKDLKLLTGVPDFMHFDQAANRWALGHWDGLTEIPTPTPA